MNKHLKIAIIGLDGANKTTAQLVGLKMDKIHDFISTIPPYTPPAWTSIFTGVNPAKHGIIGWQNVDIHTIKTKLVSSYDVKALRLSEMLDVAGFNSVIVNLPMTYPFSGIKHRQNTVIVSDWAAPEQTVYPKKLSQKYKEYLIDPPHDWIKYASDRRDYASIVREYTETRIEMYYDLYENVDWNLFFIVFSETDWFSHIYPEILEGKDTRLVKPTFSLIHKFIKEIQNTADFTFIVSDHGFEVKNKLFHVNTALAKGDFIKYNVAKLKLARLASKIIPDRLLRKAVEKTGGPSNVLEATLRPETTKAFMPTETTTWGIYVRDKNIADEVVKYLQGFEEIEKVIRTEELYSGPYLDRLPTLFIVPKEGVEYSYRLSDDITKSTYIGDHEIHGIFSVSGDGISGDILFENIPTVFDIAPTLLHLFGLPIPNDMDGRVLMEIFEPESEFAKRKPKYVNFGYYRRKYEDKTLKRVLKNLDLKNEKTKVKGESK
ncbi:MAG: hypothetical protein PWQ95_1317 [Thermococcaceae archaeon]|nr:hypothetical protein [Thermococcaceae archaeon]